MGLLDRIAESRAPDTAAQRAFVWPFPSDVWGTQYFATSTGAGGPSQEAPRSGFSDLVNNGFKGNSIVFACELKRISVFSEARFVWRRFRGGRAGGLWSDNSLGVLEAPWPRATTSDLLAEMLIMADMGGNAFVARSTSGPDRLRVLRPDYVTIVMGDSSARPVESPAQLDAEIIGFIYDPQDGTTAPEALSVDEVAHFIPPGLRDPLLRFRGMSWLTAALRELQGDQAATMHKLSFFQNGATPQLVVSFDASISEEQFKAFVAKMDETHAGWQNAYKTLYLGGGANVAAVGKDMQQLQFTEMQGKVETRIAAASGIHPVLIPMSEGMQGSSLNAGNYAAARRSTADMTFRPLWRNLCGSLAGIVPPPGGSELWYDPTQIPFLREDGQAAAEIEQVRQATITGYVKEGFTAKSAIATVDGQDVTLLEHTGLVSVQLQAPGTVAPVADVAATNGNLPAPVNVGA